MQTFQFEDLKWSQISGTVVHLKIVLGFELVTVVLSKKILSADLSKRKMKTVSNFCIFNERGGTPTV